MLWQEDTKVRKGATHTSKFRHQSVSVCEQLTRSLIQRPDLRQMWNVSLTNITFLCAHQVNSRVGCMQASTGHKKCHFHINQFSPLNSRLIADLKQTHSPPSCHCRRTQTRDTEGLPMFTECARTKEGNLSFWAHRIRWGKGLLPGNMYFLWWGRNRLRNCVCKYLIVWVYTFHSRRNSNFSLWYSWRK